MEVMEYRNQETSNSKYPSSLLINFLLFILTTVFSLTTAAQTSCIANINNGINQICLSSGSVTFSNATSSVSPGGVIQWLSSGDGSFNNPLSQNPTYTPGSNDLINGYAFIYLDVYKDDPVNYCSVLPIVTLYLGAMNATATPSAQTICSAATITQIVLSGSLSSTTYNWTRNNTASVTGISASGAGNIRGTLTNTTTAPVTVTFTITPTTTSCSGTPITATVLVNPKPNVVATPSSQTICSGATITPVLLSGSVSGTTYNWTRDNTSSVTGIAANGSGNITGALTNTTASPVTVTFTTTPTANGCTGTPITTTVLVNPTASVVVATPSSQTICSGAAITPVVLSGGANGTTYNWTRNNTASVTGIATSGSGNITGTLTNTTTAPIYVTFVITASSSSCTNTATVLVNPTASLVVATPSSQTICSGATITPIVSSGGANGATYNWTRNNTASVTGIAASGSGNITGALTNTGNAPVTVTFTITPTGTGCSGTPITATILVNPTPNVVATPSTQTICSGATITPVALSSNVSGTTYNWTRNNTASVTGIAASGSGNITGALTNTGNAPVTVTFTITPTANSCAGTAITATVLVNPTPNVVATPSTQTICSGATITPVALSSNVSGTTYNWTRNNTAFVTGIAASGSGNITGVLTNTTNAPVTVTFTITPTANSCAGTVNTATVTVNPRPTSVISGDQTVCAGQSSNISIALTGSNPWTFTYSDGTTPVTVTGNSANPYTFIVSPALPKIYTVTSLNDANCIAQVGDMTGSATLSQLSYTVTASAGTNGSITPNGVTSANCGANQVYTISPNAGFNIQDVLVDGISQGAISSYTFSNVTATHSISATFSPGAFAITATAGANGTITPAGAVAVPSGTSQTFSIAANSCYQIADIIVDGVSQGVISSYTFTNVAATHSISATFSQLNYPITASAGAHGSISPSGITLVNCKSNQVYTITSNGRFNIQDVLVDGVSQGAITTYTFSDVTAAHTISATFSSGSFTITATAGANGTITPAGAVGVASGTSQTFSIAANSCYQIADVIVDGVSQGAISSYTFNNVTATHSISATFFQLSYTITASAGANGSITPSGITNANCGTNEVYTITPNAGFNIQDVLVDGVSQGALTTYTFSNITAAHTISAIFSSGTFTITASAGANGTITPAGVVNVANGANQTFSIAANSCYQIADVIVDGISQGAISSYTFTNVTATHSISAIFSQLSYTITASAGINGSITPNGATSVNCGTSQTFSIAANSCYQVADVVVDGVSQGAISSYTFNNVTATHSISATFFQLSYTITASAAADGSITPSGVTNANCGTNEVYTITPNAEFNIQDVLVDGVSQGALTTYTFSNITAAHTISAIFSSGAFTITATAGANGTITPAGAVGVASGANQTFSIAANSCYQVADVIVDGISQGAISSYTFTNVTATHSISAIFSQLSYTITASAGANGSISPNGATLVNCGTNELYTIAPNAGFNIQDVLVDGVSQGAITTYTFSNITATHTISAIFSSGAFTITATAGTNGAITPAGAVAVASGANQTFSIATNSCYQVADIIVDGVSQGAISSYTFNNVTATHNISATFSQLSYTITASAGANGTITPNGATQVNCGTSQTFSIAANNCYQIADVVVDGVSQGAISSYTFNNVTATHSISVTFSQLSYSITASAGANGSITPNGATSVNCGANQTFSILANAGFVVQNVLVDGASQGAIATFTFTNVTATHTISATFTAATGCIAPTLSASISNVLCRSGSSGSINVTTSGGTAPFTYAWIGPTSFAATTEDVTGLAAGSYRITITATGGCTATALYTVSQPAGTLVTSATWSPILCSGATTSASISAAGGTLPYTGTGSIANQAAGLHTYAVTDANGCSASTTVTITQPSAIIISAAAGTIQCSGGTTTLTVTASGGTGTRQYSLNGGAYQAGTTFTVNAAGSPYTVTAKDANLCTVTSNIVTVTNPTISTVPAQPSAVTGSVYGLCGGGNFTYTVAAVATATSYTWTVPTGCTITSGQGTNQIQVSVPATFTGSGTIGVSATNGCGTGTQYRFTVFAVLYYPGSSITGPSVVTSGQAGVQYSLPSTAGVTYTWLVPTGAAITNGQGSNTITVKFGTTGGNISVDITNACGTAPRASKAVTIGLARSAAPADQIITAKPYFSIYPNPAQSNAAVVFSSLKTGSKFEVIISNTLGKPLFTKSGVINSGKNTVPFDLGKLTKGMYMVTLKTEETIQIQKLFKQE